MKVKVKRNNQKVLEGQITKWANEQFGTLENSTTLMKGSCSKVLHKYLFNLLEAILFKKYYSIYVTVVWWSMHKSLFYYYYFFTISLSCLLLG